MSGQLAQTGEELAATLCGLAGLTVSDELETAGIGLDGLAGAVQHILTDHVLFLHAAQQPLEGEVRGKARHAGAERQHLRLGGVLVGAAGALLLLALAPARAKHLLVTGMSSGRAEHHVAEEAALEQAGARRDVGRLVHFATPIHKLPHGHGVYDADDEVEALEKTEAQLADVGLDAGDHEGKAGFLGGSLRQRKGLGLAEGRAAYHGAAREIDDLVGVRIHDGDAAHAAEYEAF